MTAILFDLAKERAQRGKPSPAEPAPPPSSPRWKISQRGNPYVKVNGFHVVVFRRPGSWSFRIEDLETGQACFSERQYATEELARTDALRAADQLRSPNRRAPTPA